MERDSRNEQERKIQIPQSLDNYFIPNSITTCKYNLLTFLPKNLWYQFQKIANVYFVIIAILEVIPQITVSGGVPNILLPLLFVLSVSAVKDYFEDLQRRRSDKEENNRQILIWKNGNWIIMKWKNIQVGDIVKVKTNEYFPADLVLLTSSESSGLCYIETKNIDGETNLKHKLSNRILHEIFHNIDTVNHFIADLTCDSPNPLIYHFKGKISLMDQTAILGTEHFLLRGSSLKNTDWVIGIAVYTGHETKIMMNSSKSKSKFSFLESRMNSEIIRIFILQVIICCFCSIVYMIWFDNTKNDTEVYLELDEITDNNFVAFILIFFTWMLIFTNFVPISLVVALEMVKFFQAIFIKWDRKLYYEPTDMPANVQTSNLNEELGQINYIFSDKTGTLTCNIMEFRKFCINGESFGTNSRQDPASKQKNVDFVDPNFDKINKKNQEFLIHLGICHTVLTEKNENGEIEYKASSPDELALVSAARMFGVELQGRDDEQGVILNNHGKIEVYQILNILEFSSNRRRMSIIARYPNGKLYVLCKGADHILLPRLKKERNIESSWEYLEEYASSGLRTLVLGIKEISEEDYNIWNNEYIEAMEDIQNREKKVEFMFEKLETNFLLTGITAIEDKLQDDVPETISFIQQAGIKIWLLTGDKIETAINIGFSSALLTNEMSRGIIDATSEYEIKIQLLEALKNSKLNSNNFALIVSGDSLLKILKTDLEINFAKIINRSSVIFACRVSPQQKANLVKLVRVLKPDAQTLSIGDGANDVNMILAAHVGVGIAGLEGNQAVRSSDYSIAQFSYLKRLLFTHGRECYRRNTNLICYNFYKNVLLTMPLLFYGMYSAFSGQILYNMWTYQLFNVFYTSFPVVIYAIFDKDSKFDQLEQIPEYYELGLKRKLFTWRVFWLWILEASFESWAIILLSVNALGYYSSEEDGKIVGMWEISELVYIMVIIVANIRILMFTYTWYWFFIMALIFSVISYFISSLILTEWLPIRDYLDNFDGRGSTVKILAFPNTYIVIILLVVSIFTILPLFKYSKKFIKYLTPISKYDEIPNLDNDDQEVSEDDIAHTTHVPLMRKHTGFAFSGEPGQTPQITDPQFYHKYDKT